MAYTVPTVIPIDAGQNVAIGVSIPFNVNTVFNQTYTTNDQIKSNIINFVLTNKGERPLQPTYGTSLRKYIFEIIDSNTLAEIENLLKTELTLNFPIVTFQRITASSNYDQNSITISIYYYILGGDVNTINITL
jgi:phage baseplate assembly protein W